MGLLDSVCLKQSIQALMSHWIRERQCARKKWVLEKQGKHPITWDLVL